MDNEPASNVRFHRISEFHCVTNALNIIVEASNGYVIKPGSDWIGLFVVGWSSVDQYVAKQMVGQSSGSTLFPTETLPRDLSNFFQLCYFDSSNNLHGISTTFSFVGEDNSFITDASGDGVIVDINDCDDDVVMVKTSRSQLENALAKAIQEKLHLQKLLTEQTEAKKEVSEKYDALRLDYGKLEGELKRSREESISAENNRVQGRVQELERDFDRIKDQLTLGDETRLKLANENQELSGRLRELNKQVAEHQQVSYRLEESLRNAEERLSATEELKRMLQQEVESLMAVQRSLAARLEDAKGECHTLKTRCAKLEKEGEERKRSQSANGDRVAELERAHSDMVIKFLSQKEVADAAEKQATDLKLRLEKAADEYRALYKQVRRRDGAVSPRPEPAAAPDFPQPRTQTVANSMPAVVKCPLCDESVSSSEIQLHFQAHDDQTPISTDSGSSAMPKCPMCNNAYPASEIQSHVESHFD